MSDHPEWQDDFDPRLTPDDAAGHCVAVFAATPSTLPGLQDFVIRQAQRAGLDASDTARLTLIVEELFVNSLTHGKSGGGERTPLVKLTTWIPQPGNVRVDYRDHGRHFDPINDGPPPAGSADEAIDYLSRRTGGVGLWLLRHYAQQTEYTYLGDCNRFCFSVGGGAAAQTKM